MHGLHFETSIWLLAGSTRFLLSTWFRRRHPQNFQKIHFAKAFGTELIKYLRELVWSNFDVACSPQYSWIKTFINVMWATKLWSYKYMCSSYTESALIQKHIQLFTYLWYLYNLLSSLEWRVIVKQASNISMRRCIHVHVQTAKYAHTCRHWSSSIESTARWLVSMRYSSFLSDTFIY